MAGAIVVGAGPGIGASVARRAAQEGLSVGLIARSQATVDVAGSALAGSATHGVAADVTDEVALPAALDEIVARFGVPELLVYNAALVRRGMGFRGAVPRPSMRPCRFPGRTADRARCGRPT